MRSEVYWIIAANVERLELLGPADLTGNGNTLNNTLVGNDGKNILRGGACNDTLNGGNTRLTHIMGRPAVAGHGGDDWRRRARRGRNAIFPRRFRSGPH
ncbi:hypothetical protein G6N74_09975 [Mesorhizobium sp. CGMCC 1.15528]|uniref:Calcium-binding protein n=1 Tax=Mesorhizobium zhangyense TaxID=1776730 RepID=A0A7C9R6M4_9HYPH|nr:hypothetical protein [Mesorhizobium zhangyense]NGN41394.1 hypothetical protein [Mesorhizobium zhangyense]